MKELTIGEIIMALRYCVAAQNSASGEACVHCEIMKLTGCDKVQACSLLDKLSADYLSATNAELEQVRADRDAAVKDLRKLGDCATCLHDKQVGYDDKPCTCCMRGEKWQWRGIRKET